MPGMESLGILSPEAIRALKEAKLLSLIRGSEVWIDPSERTRAGEILSKIKDPVEQIYRFHGFVVRTSKDLSLAARWYGAPNGVVGQPGSIHIHEHSKPNYGLDRSDRLKVIQKIKVKGNEIDLNCNLYTPGYAGVVMTDDGGVPIIEVTPWNIYILFDTKRETVKTRKVYESNMLTFAIVLANHGDDGSKAVYDDIWKRQEPKREELEVKLFEDMLCFNIRKQEKDFKSQIERADRGIEEAQRMNHENTRLKMDAKDKLDVVQQLLNGGMTTKAREEWDRVKVLERNGAVRNLRITGDNMSFITRMIWWTPPRFPHKLKHPHGDGETIDVTEPVRLGEYKIDVTFGARYHVGIQNQNGTLSYDGERWNHPHVRGNSPCYGNMSDALAQFAAKREFEAVIMSMLKWLENVAVLDAYGKTIWYWAKEDQKRRAKEKKAEEAKKKQESKAEERTAQVPTLEG